MQERRVEVVMFSTIQKIKLKAKGAVFPEKGSLIYER